MIVLPEVMLSQEKNTVPARCSNCSMGSQQYARLVD